jgi:ferredoxin
VDDLVRRVVDGLLRGDCRGKFLCSRCLVKLAKDHLDKSHATRDVVQVMDDIFNAPGPIMHVPTATCAVCARKNMPGLGVPVL